MARIAGDAMGSDRGPAEIVGGALEARADGIEPVLFGGPGLDAQGLELHETSDVIGMHEKPAEAVRAKPESSLVAAVRAVAEGRADAVVSAGNTGAMLAAGLLELRRIPGVLRPAIAVPIPAQRGPSVLLDSGANADARPEHLLQFATMGAVFAEEILGLDRPEVPQLQGELRGARPPGWCRRRRRHGRLHRQRGVEAPRRDDTNDSRCVPRGDRRDADRKARRLADPPGSPAA